MEAQFVTSPSGARFPRTPKNVAAFEKGKGSNEKPKMKVDAVKVEDEVDADGMKESRSKIEKENAELKVEVEEYRSELGAMQDNMAKMAEHLEMMENLLESNELRSRAELGAEFNRREGLEHELIDLGRAMRQMAQELEDKKNRDKKKRQEADKDEDEDGNEKFESELTISDPAGDLMDDLSMCRPLEDKLKNSKASVTTVAGLLDHALEKHGSLRSVLKSADKYSLEFVVTKFKNKFRSLYHSSKATLSVVAILVMSRLKPAKSIAAAKYAVSVEQIPLIRAIPIARKSGSVPLVQASLKLMTLTALPGAKQLLARTDEGEIEEHWKAIEKLVEMVVGFVPDAKSKLAAAKANLNAFNGEQYADVEELLAAYNHLADICTSWFKGETESDYDKILRLLDACPKSVKFEYAEYISPKHDGESVDEMALTWEEFQELLRKVWTSARVKNQVRSDLGVDGSEENPWKTVGSQSTTPTQPVYAAGWAGRTATGAGSAGSSASPDQDKVVPSEIVCQKCTTAFVPSMKQYEKLKENGIPLPRACPKCKGQICDLFRENGECSFGENCKFLHPEEYRKTVEKENVTGKSRHAAFANQKCRFANLGKCLKGDKCEFSHENANMNKNLEPVHMAAIMPSVGWSSDVEEIDY